MKRSHSDSNNAAPSPDVATQQPEKPQRSSATPHQTTTTSTTTGIAPPRIANGFCDFDLSCANPHFTCRLCDGYFRDPVTITECLHTFCKSCLYYAFSSGFGKCPTCDVQLGPDPMKSTLHDRIKEELLDRVLFPQLRQQDETLERDFYAAKGISLKAQYLQEANKQKRVRRGLRTSTTNSGRHHHHYEQPSYLQASSLTDVSSPSASRMDDDYDGSKNTNDNGTSMDNTDDVDDDDVEFVMLPANHDMPSLGLDLMSTSGKIKILNLKRFLNNRLAAGSNKRKIEMTVRGSIVGNELSLTFIERTMWLDPEEPLEFLYQYADVNDL